MSADELRNRLVAGRTATTAARDQLMAALNTLEHADALIRVALANTDSEIPPRLSALARRVAETAQDLTGLADDVSTAIARVGRL